MDHMDTDNIVEVPDTPDRLSNRMVNERSRVQGEKNNLFTPCHLGKQECFDEGTKNQPIVINSGTRKLSICSNGNRSSSNSLRYSGSAALALGSSSSSKSALLFRKGLADKNPSNESHDSTHIQHLQVEETLCTSKSSSQDCFVDPTERSVHTPIFGKGEAPRSSQGDEFRKRLGLANVRSSNILTKFLAPTGDANERTENMCKDGSSIDNGEKVEFVGNIQNKAGQCEFRPPDSIPLPRVNRQKRLVRNGCISPHNIAKAKQLVRKDDNESVAAAHIANSSMATIGPTVWDDLKELVAEDHNSRIRKGKGVINYPCPPNEPENKNEHLLSRNSITINEKAMESTEQIRDASKIIEKPGGWRNTHNRSRQWNLPSSDEEQFLSRELDISQRAGKHHENRGSRREKGSSVAIDSDHPRNLVSLSSQNVSVQPGQILSPSRPQLGQFNGHRPAANTLMKRKKQGSNLSSSGEGSTSTSDDPEVMLVNSSGESSNSRLTFSGVGLLQPIIEVSDSPELQRNAYEEDARARQVEADEMLARELQEQLYNEVPFPGVSEIDEHIALALQQENSARSFSRGSSHEWDRRDSLIANLRRQSQSRSSSNLSRRGSHARASTSGRMTRLRSRFPGQPCTVSSSRGRSSMFPANMDVDMRMHILETLEAFSDINVDSGVLQNQHDFNENDYEMLLALDDNNDQHGGASIHQINGLPQSTIQNDNVQEACAICLDTPTIGDTIRHLPCLHKFHKDCIDLWLRRKTSCPICKCSIT